MSGWSKYCTYTRIRLVPVVAPSDDAEVVLPSDQGSPMVTPVTKCGVPLRQHSSTVAAITALLLEKHFPVPSLYRDVFREVGVDLPASTVLAAVFHDYGRAASFYQAMLLRSTYVRAQPVYHEYVSATILVSISEALMDETCCELSRNVLFAAAVVARHHGYEDRRNLVVGRSFYSIRPGPTDPFDVVALGVISAARAGTEPVAVELVPASIVMVLKRLLKGFRERHSAAKVYEIVKNAIKRLSLGELSRALRVNPDILAGALLYATGVLVIADMLAAKLHGFAPCFYAIYGDVFAKSLGIRREELQREASNSSRVKRFLEKLPGCVLREQWEREAKEP